MLLDVIVNNVGRAEHRRNNNCRIRKGCLSMKQDALAKWLKFIIVGVGFCGLLTYTVIMPRFAAYLVRQNSMLEKNVLPWLILIWISAIPCYAVLALSWKIADNIRKDRSFSYENAEFLKWISYLSMGDSVFVFLANIIFLLLDMSASAVMLVICIIVFAGISISVCAAVLSHLVVKAATIKEENDLTV